MDSGFITRCRGERGKIVLSHARERERWPVNAETEIDIEEEFLFGGVFFDEREKNEIEKGEEDGGWTGLDIDSSMNKKEKKKKSK